MEGDLQAIGRGDQGGNSHGEHMDEREAEHVVRAAQHEKPQRGRNHGQRDAGNLVLQVIHETPSWFAGPGRHALHVVPGLGLWPSALRLAVFEAVAALVLAMLRPACSSCFPEPASPILLRLAALPAPLPAFRLHSLRSACPPEPASLRLFRSTNRIRLAAGKRQCLSARTGRVPRGVVKCYSPTL